MKLSQIVVNEVSLVDKAANKRKFLLYKRDDSKVKPEDLLKSAKEIMVEIVELIKAKDDGGHNEGPNYAQQAKDLLNGVVQEAVSFYTDEERKAIGTAIVDPESVSKGATPPKDSKTSKEEDLEFSDEDVKQLEALDKAVTSLQQQLVEPKQ